MVALEELSKSGKFPKNDLTGKRFERLVVREWSGRAKIGCSYWECECICGEVRNLRYDSLLTGKTTSCGCLRVERSREACTKHGKHKTQAYIAWGNMNSRCLNPNFPGWKNYGGRGIGIYQPWIDSFELFHEVLGDPPSSRHSLDRIDNNKSYYPGNVRWATLEEQGNNKRNNRLISFCGETKTASEFAKVYGLNFNSFLSRIRYGWSVEAALTTPINIVYRNKKSRAIPVRP